MTKIQDIQHHKNRCPTASVEDVTTASGMKYYDITTLIVKNYSLYKLKTIGSLESSESIEAAIIEYDYLSGDALRIGEAINILKLQLNSLYKIHVFLPNLHFKVNFKSDDSSIVRYLSLYITSEFTARALEPIVGSILKNVYIEDLNINFETRCDIGLMIPVPVASYIFSTFEEYFATPFRLDLMEQYDGEVSRYNFYLGKNVLKNMGNELVKVDSGYKMIPGPIKKELEDFTTQELLEATLITKDLNKSNSILKILPDEIIKKILIEHVGAQELGLIANKGKLNLYYDKKIKDTFKIASLKTTNDKKSILKQNKDLIEQKRLCEEANKQYKIEVAKLRKDCEEEVNKVAEDKVKMAEDIVSIISQVQEGCNSKLEVHNEKMLEFKKSTQQKLNANVVDEFSTFMLMNEHFGNEVFQNKSTIYTVELGIASVLSTIAYKNGMKHEYMYLPMLRAGLFVAKDASYSQKESIKQSLGRYLPIENHTNEIDLLLNFVFDVAIAYASPNFYMSFLVSGANSVSDYLEASFGSGYSTLSTNYLSMAASAFAALLFASHNKHVLMESNKYPIYNAVSYPIGYQMYI